jgi:hypothetical protein
LHRQGALGANFRTFKSSIILYRGVIRKDALGTKWRHAARSDSQPNPREISDDLFFAPDIAAIVEFNMLRVSRIAIWHHSGTPAESREKHGTPSKLSAKTKLR